MSATIEIKRELPEQFLSDILVTAFDGGYGWSWHWFEPATGSWLTTKHEDTCPRTVEKWTSVPPECKCDALWMSVSVRPRAGEDYETGVAVFDNGDGVTVTHQDIANAISRIINDDYVGVWREANENEVRWYRDGVPWIRDREFKEEDGKVLCETGETARGYQKALAAIISSQEPDAGDIDACFADAIAQVAILGKVVFG